MKRDLDGLVDDVFDVLVIGGGIYGASVARDAALRGLSVALVERDDFGALTSHNSLKLIHGGIRYLQQADIGRLLASSRERSFWLRAAPTLITPLRFVIPLYGYAARGPEAFRIAALTYNMLTRGSRQGLVPAAGVIDTIEARALLPDAGPRLRGGGVWHDGQMRDANRVELACLMGAVERGARIANHLEAMDFLMTGDRVEGAVVEDRLSGRSFSVHARLTVNCAGPLVTDLLGRSLRKFSLQPFPKLQRAMNLVIGRRLTGNAAIGVVSRRKADSVVDRGGRMFFLTPWGETTVVGTEHLPFTGDPSDFDFREDEIAAFLDEINGAAPGLGLSREDVRYCYAGLTPATLDDDSGKVRQAKRGNIIDHRASDGVDGLMSVVGVKYTTARLIAERAVHQAMAKLDRPAVASTTGNVPFPALDPLPERYENRASLRARVDTAVDEEMAMRLGDLVFRRSRLGEGGRIADGQIEAIAALMADRLGWNEAKRIEEIDAVAGRLARHEGREPD
ncbi:glycerol-3-phosphate dehydrogenase/oxidase [Oceanibacterium hippocampi]|uniref:Aerobic glycerol-3-phosphate dehydrogenase n=1 Tax=Oceanibacterium hippocampi TaxID=745714 RepID=A0A1Y5T4E7_9PROT|nr:FAD-dependent oxidoreductase [Oceanibacterium hippocampi]SLN55639.1 Aerobic glycerol-3-phosphate dehydrogenase [Oceanibacterium hippocampi]